MTYRYRYDFNYIDDACAWTELYGEKRRINFLKWQLLEGKLCTELTEDEFCFLNQYILRLQNKREVGNTAADVSNLKNLLVKYRSWRDESLSFF